MALFLVVVGLILVLAVFRGKVDLLQSTLKSDLQAAPGAASQFGMFCVVALILSAVGAYRPLRPATDAFLFLILLVFLFRNGGFLPKLISAFQ